MDIEKMTKQLEATEKGIVILQGVIEGTEKKRGDIHPVLYFSMINCYNQLIGELRAEAGTYRKELGIERD